MKIVKDVWIRLWTAMAMVLLILDPKAGLDGAREAVELCIRTVIPSLFPFLFLSVLFTGNLVGTPLPFLRPLGKLCRIPPGAEGLLAVGLIGGYPIGAQSIGQAYKNKKLSKKTAQRMLGFCNNAGPSFLFGILTPMFRNKWALWSLWSIHILSAILTGMVLPGSSEAGLPCDTARKVPPDRPLERSLRAMATICGWVIIFRVALSFLQRWLFPWIPGDMAVMLSGLLELTNGCCQLSQVQAEWVRFLMASAMVSFGGVCVWLQTVSVTQALGTGYYLPGKLLQTGFSFILSLSAVPFLYPEARIGLWFLTIPVAVVSVLLIRKIYESFSSFLVHQGV